MPRPRKCRRVRGVPPVTLFKPQGIPLAGLTGVVLPLDGLEAMRLVDAEGLSQGEAAGRMDVSRPTLCRILGDARAVVARALANGWAIRVEGGPCELGDLAVAPAMGCASGASCGPGPGQGQEHGQGRGR